jgi:hypothetical protein
VSRRSAGSGLPGASLVAVALLVGLLCCPGCGREELAPLPGWGQSYEAAKQEAADQGKPLAILFSAPWSDAARDFEQKTLSDPKVRELLAGHVKVRLDLDASESVARKPEVGALDKNGYTGAPWLVLVSPQGERKSVAGQCGQEELAGFLATLGPWRPLDGWESDPVKAEGRARESGKPLAVLYSAAWEPAAAAFERKTLADQGVKAALAGFTPLRLNLAANAERARADFAKAKADAEGGKLDLSGPEPALLLPAPSGKLRAVPVECSPKGLTAFVTGLAGWQSFPGWSTDYPAAAERAKAESKPLALLLDSADWPSAKFLGMTQEFPEVAKALESFVRVRIECEKVSEQDRQRWQPRNPPCLILFDAGGKRFGAYGFKSGPSEPAGKVAERVAEGLRLAAAAKDR